MPHVPQRAAQPWWLPGRPGQNGWKGPAPVFGEPKRPTGGTVDGRTPAPLDKSSHYLQGILHSRWVRVCVWVCTRALQSKARNPAQAAKAFLFTTRNQTTFPTAHLMSYPILCVYKYIHLPVRSRVLLCHLPLGTASCIPFSTSKVIAHNSWL